MNQNLVVHFGKYSKIKHGGVETVLRGFVNTKKFKHQFICYGKDTEIELFDETKCNINFSFLKQPFSYMYIKFLFEYLYIKKAIIILHMPNLQLLVMFRLLALFSNRKIIIFWHADPYSGKTALLNFLQKRLLFLAIGKKIRIITTSQLYKAGSDFLLEIPNDFLDVCTLCIPESTDIILERYAVNKKKSLQEKNVHVLAVGRLVKYKNFEELIRSFVDLDECYVLNLVGDGPLKKNLSNLIYRLGLEHRVKILGSLPQDELIKEYRKADIFCLPSNTRAEAFGIVLIEAIAANLPIVINGCLKSGTIDIANIYPYSFKFNSKYPLSLTETLEKARNCVVEQDMCKKIYIENFSIEKFNKIFSSILE
ncbi:glycosyltransferase [Amylibacter sp.]|nr:glycosyltransferase [Amylibacter sp.]